MNKFYCTIEYVLKFIAFLVLRCIKQCDWCNCNAVDFCSEGAWFEFWPGHGLFWDWPLLWVFILPAGKLGDSTSPVRNSYSQIYSFYLIYFSRTNLK